MPTLRKSSIVLALVVMAMLSTGVANAQPFQEAIGVITCSATAVPPVVRAEGIAEIVGDIVLACTNTPPAAGGVLTAYLVSNLSVSLNVNVTNNIGFNAFNGNITDAVLVINENNSTTPVADPTATLPGNTGTLGDAFVPLPQFGRLAANNRLEWDQVNFPVPGAPRNPSDAGATPGGDCAAVVNGCFPDITTIRITSVRANASELRVPDQAQFPSTQIQAFVSITGPTLLPITNNVLNVAVPIVGLLVDISDAVTAGLQCIDLDAEAVQITLEEGFATAFKTLGVGTFTPGNTQWESGYFAPGSNNGAGARQATRFMLRFFNIPEGVTIEVPVFISMFDAVTDPTNFLIVQIVNNTDSNGAGGTVNSSTDPTLLTAVSLSGGFGTAVYEVVASNPFAVEDLDISVFVSWEADTENDLPAVGSGQISASFAPLSTVFVASATAPEPRFIDTGADPQTFLSIVRCTTTILFPFVTNQAGFDTGIAISNTSQDWLGTQPQDGACTIHYHGETTGGGAAPPDQTSSVIDAGGQLTFTLSGGNPGKGIAGAPEFQGYIIAVCDFQYGHGYAFITNGFGGVPTMAQGYLALIIPAAGEGLRPAGLWHLRNNDTSFVSDGFGERLAH
jgi:hypothetical protein